MKNTQENKDFLVHQEINKYLLQNESDCINIKSQIEKERQAIIKSLGKRNFEDVKFNKLLDKLSEIKKEARLFENLKKQFPQSFSREDLLKQAESRINFIKNLY